MRKALEYARLHDLPVIEHCETLELTGDGAMREGAYAAWIGLPGIPAASEFIAVERNIALAEITGARLHVAHLSTERSAAAVRRAKAAGLRVTAEVTPHHLVLTEEAVGDYDTAAKMKPPLAADADREALLTAIADGTADAIATDHAPHHEDEKKLCFESAPFGIVGLETAVPLVLDRLVASGAISLPRAVRLLSTGPRRILGLPGGDLRPGSPADITLLDLEATSTIDPESFRSRGSQHSVRRALPAGAGRGDLGRRAGGLFAKRPPVMPPRGWQDRRSSSVYRRHGARQSRLRPAPVSAAFPARRRPGDRGVLRRVALLRERPRGVLLARTGLRVDRAASRALRAGVRAEAGGARAGRLPAPLVERRGPRPARGDAARRPRGTRDGGSPVRPGCRPRVRRPVDLAASIGRFRRLSWRTTRRRRTTMLPGPAPAISSRTRGPPRPSAPPCSCAGSSGRTTAWTSASGTASTRGTWWRRSTPTCS